MAWTTPTTWTSGAVLTAAQLNQQLRDNLNETAPAKFTAAGQMFVSTAANAGAARTPQFSSITTLDNVTSSSYVDATTPGPAVTVTSGTTALVIVACKMLVSAATDAWMGFAVSGATTAAAFDSGAFSNSFAVSTVFAQGSMAFLDTGLTAGSNTFTAKYRVGANTGGFSSRKVTVLPF